MDSSAAVWAVAVAVVVGCAIEKLVQLAAGRGPLVAFRVHTEILWVVAPPALCFGVHENVSLVWAC